MRLQQAYGVLTVFIKLVFFSGSDLVQFHTWRISFVIYVITIVYTAL